MAMIRLKKDETYYVASEHYGLNKKESLFAVKVLRNDYNKFFVFYVPSYPYASYDEIRRDLY